jgi:sugar/nucleoside kinase (ribokinase family)
MSTVSEKSKKSPHSGDSLQTIDVLGLGYAAVDELIYVDAYPIADTKSPVRRRERQCGGLTATALATAARLGCRCAYAGTLGEDDDSRFVIEQFCKHDIDLSLLRRRADAHPVRSSIIVDSLRHTRTILYDLNGVVGPDKDWPPEATILAARVLLVDDCGIPGMIRAAQIARNAGIPVVADFENANHALFPELLALADHLILSWKFASDKTGIHEPAAVVEALWTSERQAVVVTCGQKGCWYIADGEPGIPKHQLALTVNAVDTTGCGDVFHGAYAAAIIQGRDIPDAVRFATITAGLKALSHGGQAGIPTRNEVDARMAEAFASRDEDSGNNSHTDRTVVNGNHPLTTPARLDQSLSCCNTEAVQSVSRLEGAHQQQRSFRLAIDQEWGSLDMGNRGGMPGAISTKTISAKEIEEALAEQSMFDVHTHLVGGRLGARGLHDILLYHMVVSDLYAAGCPSGARLTQYPAWPTQEEAHARIEEAMPFLQYTRNTSCSWGLQLILRDLYDWREPITLENWRRLDSAIRERADDRTWWHSILDRLKIRRSCTEIVRRGQGEDDDRLQYALEWAFFARRQWGEFDTALYELERVWGKEPEAPMPIGGGSRPTTERTICTLDDVHAAIAHYVSSFPYKKIISTATGFSTDIDYRIVSEAEMSDALSRRGQAGQAERDIYASYINEAYLTELEKSGHGLVFQFSIGAEPLPFEAGALLSQRTIGQLAEMIARHPRLHFQCFLASRSTNQAFCTLARELPNLSLAGYWWHNFFPDSIHQIIAERLDMLPVNKQVGFFSDAYCLEWTYGKALLVRKQLASVLAENIRNGRYTRDDALAIAGAILYETPRDLMSMIPCNA